jgi:metallo-beta-lactamase family protein
MAKKEKDKIRVSFVGQSSHEVTGSCIHIQTETQQILLECGLYQSCESPIATYKKNTSDLGFKIKEIDKIFMCHDHIDHIGLAPRLYKKGCQAEIIAPSGSSTIAKLLLFDCAHIAEKDAEFIEKRTKKSCEPLYDESDVETAMAHWTEYPFDEVIDLGDGIAFRFVPSGHILNSAQLELWITQGNLTKKIVYTSDLGNITVEKHYVDKFQPIEQCQLMIGESTYADKSRTISKKDREKDLEKIKSVITEKCVEGHGRVLFPVFANDRCQNILTCLYEIFGHDENFTVPILIDSPMAINISKAYLELLPEDQLALYEKAFNWENVKLVQDYNDSKTWQMSHSPAVILSCSGMMTNGRSVQWAKRLLPSAQNHVLFVGYSAVGSLAAKIKEGRQKTITIEQKPVANRCGITSLVSFSSHMQHDDLLEYYSNVQCEKVALVHGDYENKCAFAKELQEEISKKNKTSRVVCVNNGTEILL